MICAECRSDTGIKGIDLKDGRHTHYSAISCRDILKAKLHQSDLQNETLKNERDSMAAQQAVLYVKHIERGEELDAANRLNQELQKKVEEVGLLSITAGGARSRAVAERDDAQEILKRFTDLDCCTGYTLSRDDYAKFWDALDDARRLLKADLKRKCEHCGDTGICNCVTLDNNVHPCCECS